jgi:hypothetical protein
MKRCETEGQKEAGRENVRFQWLLKHLVFEFFCVCLNVYVRQW